MDCDASKILCAPDVPIQMPGHIITTFLFIFIIILNDTHNNYSLNETSTTQNMLYLRIYYFDENHFTFSFIFASSEWQEKKIR